ncbi:MAG: hypothetical protein AAGA76_12665, partial [Pseudomonadota bacterium]
MRHSPNVIEIIRTDTSTVESAIAHLIEALKSSGVTWNYLDGTKRIKSAYKGLHSINTLTAISESKLKRPGQVHNIELVKLVAPLAFGRKTQVFDLSPRHFQYADNRSAAYRLPFFFSEDGVVKAFGLQFRKNGRLSNEQIAGYASIVKRFLLETEFYDMPADIEFIDCGVPAGSEDRVATKYSLIDLDLWTDEKIQSHMEVVVEALRFIEDNE